MLPLERNGHFWDPKVSHLGPHLGAHLGPHLGLLLELVLASSWGSGRPKTLNKNYWFLTLFQISEGNNFKTIVFYRVCGPWGATCMGGVHEILPKASKSLYFTRYFEPSELEKWYYPEEVPL